MNLASMGVHVTLDIKDGRSDQGSSSADAEWPEINKFVGPYYNGMIALVASAYLSRFRDGKDDGVIKLGLIKNKTFNVDLNGPFLKMAFSHVSNLGGYRYTPGPNSTNGSFFVSLSFGKKYCFTRLPGTDDVSFTVNRGKWNEAEKINDPVTLWKLFAATFGVGNSSVTATTLRAWQDQSRTDGLFDSSKASASAASSSGPPEDNGGRNADRGSVGGRRGGRAGHSVDSRDAVKKHGSSSSSGSHPDQSSTASSGGRDSGKRSEKKGKNSSAASNSQKPSKSSKKGNKKSVKSSNKPASKSGSSSSGSPTADQCSALVAIVERLNLFPEGKFVSSSMYGTAVKQAAKLLMVSASHGDAKFIESFKSLEAKASVPESHSTIGDVGFADLCSIYPEHTAMIEIISQKGLPILPKNLKHFRRSIDSRTPSNAGRTAILESVGTISNFLDASFRMAQNSPVRFEGFSDLPSAITQLGDVRSAPTVPEAPEFFGGIVRSDGRISTYCRKDASTELPSGAVYHSRSTVETISSVICQSSFYTVYDAASDAPTIRRAKTSLTTSDLELSALLAAHVFFINYAALPPADFKSLPSESFSKENLSMCSSPFPEISRSKLTAVVSAPEQCSIHSRRFYFPSTLPKLYHTYTVAGEFVRDDSNDSDFMQFRVDGLTEYTAGDSFLQVKSMHKYASDVGRLKHLSGFCFVVPRSLLGEAHAAVHQANKTYCEHVISCFEGADSPRQEPVQFTPPGVTVFDELTSHQRLRLVADVASMVPSDHGAFDGRPEWVIKKNMLVKQRTLAILHSGASGASDTAWINSNVHAIPTVTIPNQKRIVNSPHGAHAYSARHGVLSLGSQVFYRSTPQNFPKAFVDSGSPLCTSFTANNSIFECFRALVTRCEGGYLLPALPFEHAINASRLANGVAGFSCSYGSHPCFNKGVKALTDAINAVLRTIYSDLPVGDDGRPYVTTSATTISAQDDDGNKVCVAVISKPHGFVTPSTPFNSTRYACIDVLTAYGHVEFCLEKNRCEIHSPSISYSPKSDQ
jgi:hypothetical protein